MTVSSSNSFFNGALTALEPEAQARVLALINASPTLLELISKANIYIPPYNGSAQKIRALCFKLTLLHTQEPGATGITGSLKWAPVC